MRPHSSRLVAAAALAAAAHACKVPDIDYAGKDCTMTEGCPGGLVCDRSSLKCVAPSDGGAPPVGGPDAGPADGGGSTPLTLDEFCAQAHDVLSDSTARCMGGSAASWRLFNRGLATRLCNEMRQTVGSGQGRFQGDLARDVLDQLRGISCVGFQPTWFGLLRLLVSTSAPLGSSCFSDFACDPGLRCLNVTTTCPGSCQPYGGIGTPCAYDSDCGSGLLCDGTSCQRFSGEREPCVQPARPCRPELTCSPDGYCVPRGTDGAACSNSSQCAETHYCDLTFSPPACRLRKGPPEPCTAGQCEMLSWCVAGQCTAWSTVGGPCGFVSGEIGLCLQGYCTDIAAAAPHCAEFVGAGTACAGMGILNCDPVTTNCANQVCQTACYLQAP